MSPHYNIYISDAITTALSLFICSTLSDNLNIDLRAKVFDISFQMYHNSSLMFACSALTSTDQPTEINKVILYHIIYIFCLFLIIFFYCASGILITQSHYTILKLLQSGWEENKCSRFLFNWAVK